MHVSKSKNEKDAFKGRTHSLIRVKNNIMIFTSSFLCSQEHDIKFDEHGLMVLGCGPYHIGKVITYVYIGLYRLCSTFHLKSM